MIDAKGNAVLIDFGLSREDGLGSSGGSASQVGGVPRWLAPELFTADGSAPVKSWSTDAYSFGCLMLLVRSF